MAYAGAVAPEAIQAVGLMAEDRRDVGLLAVTSADRLNAGWTAAQRAHRVRSLGVENFGQTGSIPELYRHYGIDANAIVAAAAALTPGRPIRHLHALR